MSRAADVWAVQDSVIDWGLAERVALRFSSKASFTRACYLAGLSEEFDRCTSLAEDLVTQSTGLCSLSGDVRSCVLDRSEWIRRNLFSLCHFIEPLLADTGSLSAEKLSSLELRVSAIELGAALGWMSTRVLGQYDFLVTENDSLSEQDFIYYVGPNVVALERKYAFEPVDFRLWLAIHEVTHRAQFTGVEWMRDHYLNLIRGLLVRFGTYSRGMTQIFQPVFSKYLYRLFRLNSPSSLEDSSFSISAKEENILDRVIGLMSLLEGHADVIMRKASKGMIQGSERFSRVMRVRRQPNFGMDRILYRFFNLDLKIAQYAEGENFVNAIEKIGGSELFQRVWENSVNLPSVNEIRNPKEWVDRIMTTIPNDD